MAIAKFIPFTLTAASQQSTPVHITKTINASFNVVVASIGTNVVLRAEFSLDGGTTWSNCNASDTTITANGQYTIPVIVNNVQVPLVRLNWISTSSGTPTVTGGLRFTK